LRNFRFGAQDVEKDERHGVESLRIELRIDPPMRGFIWLVLALLLFVAWVGSYIVYHVAGILIHLLLVFSLISVLIYIYSEIREPGPRH
jgi:4-hydroxybenzoate polyprenyltransferase